jgi:hypothetical protein
VNVLVDVSGEVEDEAVLVATLLASLFNRLAIGDEQGDVPS